MSPKEACLDAVNRVARNFNNGQSRLAPLDINFYALRKDGEYAGATLWSHVVKNGNLVPKQFAVNAGGESRLENCAWLYERKRA
jgi:N4-(beta-N-acetylglucosaminyl)-L-asparaginase